MSKRNNRRNRNKKIAIRPSAQPETRPQIENFTPGTGVSARSHSQRVEISQWSGPLPPAGFLKEINEICPGGADRIIVQMEEQGRHRRGLEQIVVTGDDRREDRGQLFGFILCLIVVIGGFILLALGISIAGYISLVAGLGIPAGLFVYKKIEQKHELESKKKDQNKQLAKK